MPARLRKLIGSFAVLAYLPLYAWAAVMLGERLPQGFAVKLAYFAVAGIGWAVPLLPLIAWMNRPDRP